MQRNIHIDKANIIYDLKKEDYDIDTDTLIFTKGLLFANWLNTLGNSIFNIYIHILEEPIVNKNGKILIALIKPYHDYKEFNMEKLFRYGDCINKEKYNENKIIGIQYLNNINDKEIYFT